MSGYLVEGSGQTGGHFPVSINQLGYSVALGTMVSVVRSARRRFRSASACLSGAINASD